VAPNSPASQAGLQAGDIITSLGGVPMDATHSYINTLFTFKPGDQVTVEFNRNGQTHQVQATLSKAS
jgi:putative serine protease PepD